MKIFKKIFNKKKTVKQNIYNMKLNCPHCSSGDFFHFSIVVFISVCL